MSSPPNPINVRFPFELKDQHAEVVQAHRYAFQGLVDANQAIASLKSQIDKIKIPTSSGGSVSTSTSITVNGNAFSGLGAVRDQTGSVTYTTVGADNGILLILNDASPVAVTLDSAMVTPFFLLVTNFGAGASTLTPTSGTVNGGGSLVLLQGQTIWVVFNGTNWQTGAFTTPPQNTPAVSHEFITAFNAATGAFSQAQPDFTDISGSLAVGQLPADVPQVSFGVGAPAGSSTEGYLYFDTTLAVYVGYVYHSGAWNQF